MAASLAHTLFLLPPAPAECYAGGVHARRARRTPRIRHARKLFSRSFITVVVVPPPIPVLRTTPGEEEEEAEEEEEKEVDKASASDMHAA